MAVLKLIQGIYIPKQSIIVVIVIILFFTFIFPSELIASRTIKEVENNNISLFEEDKESYLKPGDIAFKSPDLFPWPVDHSLIFVEHDELRDQYCFIEAHYKYGVHFRWAGIEELKNNTWGPYVRVKTATSVQKQNAIDFAKRQIGKEFQGEWINKNFNPEDVENDSLACDWYCSELIWAAYYNCNNSFPEQEPLDGYSYGEGIDLDRNNGDIVAPSDILLNIKHVKIFNIKEKKEQIKSKNVLDNSFVNTNFYKLFKHLLSIFYFSYF